MSDSLEQLRGILNKAGVADNEIAAGLNVTDRGLHKIAARMGTSVDEVKTLCNSLTTMVRRDLRKLDEETSRYVYEVDGLGVTIRDTESGDEHYYSGSQGEHIIRELRPCVSGSPDEQAVLAKYAPGAQLNERSMPGKKAKGEFGRYTAEINSDAGMFNFPWELGRFFGTATASYSGRKPDDLHIEVVDVRDQDGHEMPLDDGMKDALHDQAVSFIDRA